jgi:hypothetical protein
MPLSFDQKLSQTRTYTQDNQLGVDSQEVYNEALLQAIENNGTSGTSLNNATAEVATVSGATAPNFVSVSFLTSSTFSGTILGAAVPANTSININAENGALLQPIDYTIAAGSILITKLARV